MKKSVCLMAILGALCATGANAVVTANDQTVDIRFTGMVSESTCLIQLKGNGTELNLGVLKKPDGGWQAGTKGSLVPVIFSITGCDKQKVTAIELENDLLGDNFGNTDLTNGTLSTKYKAINVQLYKDAAAVKKGLNKVAFNLTGDHTQSQAAGEALLGYAALEHNGDKTEQVQAGDLIEAKAMFKISFQ